MTITISTSADTRFRLTKAKLINFDITADNNNAAWHDLQELFDWLETNAAGYAVIQFQNSRVIVAVPSQEIITLIKLSFDFTVKSKFFV